ncbi:VOC family protein [Bacillus sp. ISL-47]|uniref:VOC family protein n=1 Tax=Bacillus sp. ISL-47 TaxID=2819130 RepID=UPI001BED03F1|nr:VOC family protein [Bacillus sp. ISL-47]MBT2691203.1 VOC family protein [Bacillus sp. ISL-47]MBT2709910.1 VOC family protein [Pseudomonas sp. ISL-84]
MELKLDHIVHFTGAHPAEAVTGWKNHGYHAVMGGSHENWGSYNSLLYIGHSYLEFLSIENNKIAAQSDNPLITQLTQDLQNGEGVGQICFRTNNIYELQRELENKGCETHPIFQGSRKRKDGSTISWSMLFIKNNPNQAYPFFIDWGMVDEMRFEELKKLGMLDEKLENAHIQAIFIAAKDSDKSAKEWTRLFPFKMMGTYKTSSQNEKRTSIQAGSAEIVFCQPLHKESKAAEVLDTRGERPFAVQFAPSLEKEVNLFGSSYL